MSKDALEPGKDKFLTRNICFTDRTTDIFLKCRAGSAANIYLSIVRGDGDQILRKPFCERRDGRGVVSSWQGP